ncbi:MAG: hypothetical protein IJ112_02260 [Oscillospiraceae bacterium]|nr:hypothetical protein [Oscillospiraceae bacterium]
MDDLQATLQALLDDPSELEQLAQTAASLLGGGDDAAQAEAQMPDLKQMLEMMRSGRASESKKLISALSPYLSAQRRARLERAARIASFSSLAELALGGEEEHG